MFRSRKPGRRRRSTRASGTETFLSADHLAGVAAIGPDEVPQSMPGYPQLCSLLGRARLTELGGNAGNRIHPRPQGYALLAIHGPDGRPLTVVSEETAKARLCQNRWARGASDDQDFLFTAGTVVAVIDGWPIPMLTWRCGEQSDRGREDRAGAPGRSATAPCSPTCVVTPLHHTPNSHRPF